jgi:hypothetical protein
MFGSFSYENSINATASLYDISCGIFLAIILWTALSLYGKKYKKQKLYTYFAYGVLIRILSTFVSALLTKYYFLGGDTTMYYTAILEITHADWSSWWEFISHISNQGISDDTFSVFNDGETLNYMYSSSNSQAVRFGALFNLICVDSYIAISLCFGIFGFVGCWRIFKVFISFFPHLTREAAFSILYLPSVWFWGVGILKDPLCLGLIGLVTYSAHNIFFKGRRFHTNVIVFILSVYLLFLIKSYIILAFMPALFLWIYLEYNHKIRSGLLRIIFGVLGIGLFLLFFTFTKGLSSSENVKDSRLAGDNMLESIQNQQAYYADIAATQGTSYANSGYFDGSVSGLITTFPNAVNTTFFRPYLWEVSNPLMLLGAIESFCILLLTLQIVNRLGIRKVFRRIFTTPFLSFCFIFSFFFAGFVGISTYNFGSISRYKIPCMPFYLMMLFVLLNDYKKNKIQRAVKTVK